MTRMNLMNRRMGLKYLNRTLTWTLIIIMVAHFGSASLTNSPSWKSFWARYRWYYLMAHNPANAVNAWNSANRNLGNAVKARNPANAVKARNSAKYVNPRNHDPPYATFLDEQCRRENGRYLVTVLTRKTSFCEKYDNIQECEWCAIGKILHDCVQNRKSLENMVRQYIDWDGNRKLSTHERSAIPDPIDFYQTK